MVLLIAHRGLISGPNNKENHPDTIEDAISLGYDAEIDLRYFDDYNELWLGHDNYQYEISLNWLKQFQNNLWIHAKSIQTLYYLSSINWNGNYFFHDTDKVTLTSNGFLWTYPNELLTPNSVMLMPEWHQDIHTFILKDKCYGICSDYVEILKHKI